MPIFDRDRRPVFAAALVLFAGLPWAVTHALSLGANTGGEIVIAAGAETTTTNPPTTIETVSPANTANAALEDVVENLPISEQPIAWFTGGNKAYNAGDGQLAVDRWTKAADRGHIGAQWNLARLYRRGDIVAADPVKALTYLRIVADQHDPNRIRDLRSAITVAALVELADIYRAGEPRADLVPDPRRASAVYNIAASLYGDARAQHELGMMYLTGEGVRQHIGRAVRWLGLSAAKLYAPSFSALGDIFWEKRESGDNKAKGLMWLSLARDNVTDDDLRALAIDRYEAAMFEANDEERQRAEGLVKTWSQNHGIQ